MEYLLKLHSQVPPPPHPQPHSVVVMVVIWVSIGEDAIQAKTFLQLVNDICPTPSRIQLIYIPYYIRKFHEILEISSFYFHQ
jgi:hypothetical protein